MTIGTLGTNTNVILKALNAWSQALSDADIAAISQGIVSDFNFGAVLGGGSIGAGGILATGATHTNTTLDTLVATGGGGLATIRPGMLVLAADIPPGTFVASVTSGTAVVLSAAATGSNSERVAFVPVRREPYLSRQGAQLVVPNRGVLRVLPGDVVAVDNTGWPVLVSGAAIAYAGSQWHKV